MFLSIFKNALSNHSCNSDYELQEASGQWDMYGNDSNFDTDSLYYHKDMTDHLELVESKEQFTVFKTKKTCVIVPLYS